MTRCRMMLQNKLFLALLMLISVTIRAAAQDFTSEPIPETVFQRIQGHSFKTGVNIKRSDLRFLKLLYVNEKGETKHGEMICNKAIASDLIDIFRELYNNRYPIHSIRLIDEYNADDELSMEDNNTSCFNYRGVTGGKNLSRHAYGMAVDINPLWNPYIRITGKHAGEIQPKNAKRGHIIDRNDLCYKLFTKHGFKWGGAWKSVKDYQHFEK